MNEISLKSYGKINIFLHILGKRPDGFHELYTLFSKISLHDTLNIKKSPVQKIVCTRAGIPTDERNIISRVQKILEDDFSVTDRFYTEIIKNIPEGGGLGGGSSNAAAYLEGVCTLAGLDMDIEKKTEVMSRVGSDTAFFLHNGPMLGQGRGEILSKWGRLPGCKLLLVNPGFAVPTGDVFSSGNLKLTTESELNKMRHASDYEDFGKILFNGLEQAVFKMFPQVAEVKDALIKSGADHALMSGSGATVFGIFKNAQSAEKAEAEICSKHPGWTAHTADLI